jgi:hypothetical protein
MGNPTATLERDQELAMNFPASQLDESEPDGAVQARDMRPGGARAAAMKFTYPSGSRPLEGYTIKRGVGRGGFGEVYFATSDAGKEVAIKLIRRNLEVELRGVSQCLNLKHPNLVGVYDIRTDAMDDQWVIMEFVSGESLEDAIDRHPNGMPIEMALWWMRGMCGGVAYLHDHGIVHRDLKPGNIFCDEGTVKIGDYGLAKFISCSRRSGQTESVGTVHYMAPEIANGRYGREIDTYALGIILFEMLTGTVPFEGESVGEVLMKHLTAEPDLSKLEEPYRDIVRGALAKDPEVRIKSVPEMFARLPGEFASADGRSAYVPEIVLKSVVAEESVVAAVQNASTPSAEPARPLRAEDIEEQIWKALRELFGKVRLGTGADGKPPNPLWQGAIAFSLVVAVIVFGFQVGALMVPMLICYGIYYVIWVSFLRPNIAKQQSGHANQQAASAQRANGALSRADAMTAAWTPTAGAQPVSPASRYAQQLRRRKLRPSWRDQLHRELAAKPLRDKFSELFGSMLAAAMFAALAALVAPVLMRIDSQSGSMAVYIWLAIVGTLGSWAILVPTKFAEGQVEDQVPMRVVLLILGGLVGVAAWALAGALLVRVPAAGEPIGANWGVISNEVLEWKSPVGGVNPSLAAYVTYFAFLFVLLRWWRQAEYQRDHRLSLGVWRCACSPRGCCNSFGPFRSRPG